MAANLLRQGVGARVEKHIIHAIREIQGRTPPDGYDDALALRDDRTKTAGADVD
jgi:hypothetical protein